MHTHTPWWQIHPYLHLYSYRHPLWVSHKAMSPLLSAPGKSLCSYGKHLVVHWSCLIATFRADWFLSWRGFWPPSGYLILFFPHVLNVPSLQKETRGLKKPASVSVNGKSLSLFCPYKCSTSIHWRRWYHIDTDLFSCPVRTLCISHQYSSKNTEEEQNFPL